MVTCILLKAEATVTALSSRLRFGSLALSGFDCYWLAMPEGCRDVPSLAPDLIMMIGYSEKIFGSDWEMKTVPAWCLSLLLNSV